MQWVAMLALAFALSAQTAAPATFCERMAPQIGMKPVERGRQGHTAGEWSVNTLGGIGPALLGGTSVMSISIRPIGEHSFDEAARIVEEACAATKKGQICRIT